MAQFEIFADDPETVAAFYRGVLGWQVDKAPGVDYWRIRTGAADAARSDGGITYRPLPGLHGWLNYVTVDSLDAAIADARRLGGEVIRPKTAVPKAGWVAILTDPDGNAFAVWQNDPGAFPPHHPD